MNYDDSVKIFLGRLPELESVIDRDERDLPHVALGGFAIYLLKKVGEVGGEHFVRESVTLLNEMAMTDDDKLKSLLSMGIVEVLLDDPTKLAIVQALANAELKIVIDQVRIFWEKQK